MSGEKIDKLFRSKLEGIAPKPSAEAWSAVQTRLEDRKSVWFYVRIAATVLLFLTFGGLYLFNSGSKNSPTESIAENLPVEAIPHVDTALLDTTRVKDNETTLKSTDEKTAVVDSTIQNSKKKENQVNLKPSLAKANLADNQDKTPFEMPDKTPEVEEDSMIQRIDTMDMVSTKNLVAENDESDATSEIKETSSSQNESKSGSTLIFDIEDFDMKTAVTSAYEAAEETKKSGLKKVLNFVKSVKEGEAGLGGLREAKNNLLSIKRKEKEDDNSR
ncbi:MAG: hypothetical protein AAF519_01530 [Bacteroidota bacterium]